MCFLIIYIITYHIEQMQSIFAVSKSYYSSHSHVYVPAWIIGSHAWKAGSVWIKMSSLGCSNMPADHNLSVTTPTLSAFDWMVNSAQCIQTATMPLTNLMRQPWNDGHFLYSVKKLVFQKPSKEAFILILYFFSFFLHALATTFNPLFVQFFSAALTYFPPRGSLKFNFI